MGSSFHKRFSKGFVLAINVICGLVILITFIAYTVIYHDRLHRQNIRDIENLNKSATTMAGLYFKSANKQVRDMAKYINFSKFTEEEALKYIYYSDSDNNAGYQLIGEDYTGHVTEMNERREFIAVDYTSNSYRTLQNIFSKISKKQINTFGFMPEFTDGFNAAKSFAIYVPVDIMGEDGTKETKTLMYVNKTKSFIDSIQMDGGYQGMSTVLIDNNGNYIMSNSAYKGSNLFKYFMTYNDLTSEEKSLLWMRLEIQMMDTSYIIIAMAKSVYFHI